uniref:Ribonuclease A-domain domain-containing protein n=1 Tax=Mus spicilegus TaxID=10103 RepID=A0A8C6HVN8_MUSSI
KFVKARKKFLCLLYLLRQKDRKLESNPRPAPSQKFYTEPIHNSTYPRCDDAMLVVNRYRPRCKDIDTFLHTSFANVGVCGHPSGFCKEHKSANCHNSSSQVPIIVCNLTTPGRTYTQCRYQMKGSVKYYRVACENRTPWDSPIYPVVPVHLHGTF